MPSVNNLYFVPFNEAETALGLSASTRFVVADKYVYTADDVMIKGCAILDVSGTVTGDLAEVYLKTADLVTTIASATKTATFEGNRIVFTMSISDLTAGNYAIQAFISEAGSPGVPTGTAVTFPFTKSATTSVITFPVGGLQVYPQTQNFIADVSYPMHAAIPIPKGTLNFSDVANLGFYEDDVQIPAQIEIVDRWEGVATDVDQDYRPKWIHVWFNAVWASGSPKIYKLKTGAGAPPSSGVTITNTNEFVFTTTVDQATSTYSATTAYYLGLAKTSFINVPAASSNILTSSISHGQRTGTPILFSSYGSPGSLTIGNIYYLRSVTNESFTLHPTYDDAINNTNIVSTGAATFCSIQPLRPIAIKIPFGTSAALIPDAYPKIDPEKVYWALVRPPLPTKGLTFTIHESYNDAVQNKNKITFLSATAGHDWKLATARTILANCSSSWNSVIGHGNSTPHYLSTGMMVRGGMYYPNATGLDDKKIYHVRVISASAFSLHPTATDATNNTNPITVSSSFWPHYFMVMSTTTVDNGYVKATFARPFDGIHELYYDPSGTGTYSTPHISSATNDWSAGLYMKDGVELDWNSFADCQSIVEIESQSSVSNQSCNVVIRAEGSIQTMNQWIAPSMNYTMRFNIPSSQPMIKCQLATTIRENISKAVRSLVFNVPLTNSNSYLFSAGVDDGTISENVRTIVSVSTPNINLNSAHGWANNQPITFFTDGGTLPSPLVQGTTYYVRNPGSDTIQVATTANGSPLTITTSGSGTRKVYVDSPAYFYQRKHNAVTTYGPVTGSGQKCDGWFSASGLSNSFRTTIFTKNIWQKFPKEISLYRNNIGVHIWPYHGTRQFTTTEESSASEVYKYDCLHQHLCLDTNIPNDYYYAWADQTDTTNELRPEWAMSANAQGVSMNNEFAIYFSDSDVAIDAENLTKLYQQSPIALPDEDWSASSKVFLTMGKKGSDFATEEQAIVDGITGWTNPEKTKDYGQFNFGDFHSNYLPSVPRANLDNCWTNMQGYFTSQIWALILRGTQNLMEIARRSTDHYASVDMTRFDGNFGYFGGNLTLTNQHSNLVTGPEHKNHLPGNFWKGGPIHWANLDYGMTGSGLSGVYGSIPDPIGLLRAWLIDGNRWAKSGFEQWNWNVRNKSIPAISGFAANKEAIGTLTMLLLSREYTHNPIFNGQINAHKTALAVSSTSKTATFLTGTNKKVSITNHGYKTGQRIRFTTTGELPTSTNTNLPRISAGTVYYVAVVNANEFALTTTYQQAIKYIHGTSTTAYTFSTSGTGTHTAITFDLPIDDPTWHPLWIAYYYELTSDPNYTQWILDNSKYLGPAWSALAYNITGEPYYLSRHFRELAEQTRLLHEENGNEWDGFGVGPAENKHFWHVFPYFKKHLQNASVTSLLSPTMVIQPDATYAEDAYIVNAFSTNNFGTSNNLLVGNQFFLGNINYRTLIRFKIDLPPESTITNATLTLTHVSGGSGISNDTITAYRVLRGWTESTVCWAYYEGTNAWTTAGANNNGSDHTTTNSVSVVLANSSSNLVMNLTTLAQDAIDSRSGYLSLLLVGPEGSGSNEFASFGSSDNSNVANRPKLSLSWITTADFGSYPIALGTPGDVGTANNTILINNALTDWDLIIDVADVTGSESMDVNISTISGTILNTNYTFPTGSSFTLDHDGNTVHRQVVDLTGATAGSLQTVTIRTNTPQIFMDLGPHPEALLMTDFGQPTTPVYRGKSFKGFFVPKIENADIELTFTTIGDDGFTRLLIKDDNDDVIIDTSLMLDRGEVSTITIQPDGSGNNNDTYVNQNSPNSNYGSSTSILVGHTQEENEKEEVTDYDYRALLKFDLNSLAGLQIASATLTLTNNGSDDPQTLNLYRCSEPNWTELGANWSTYNGVNPWSGGAGNPTAPSVSLNYTGGDAVFDVTDLVNDAMLHRGGILNCVLDGSTDTSYLFASFASMENGTASSRPKITAIPTSASVTLTINDSDVDNPTPWYVEATSGRNSFVDIKVEGPGDATPILFGSDRDDTVTMKYWAIGTPVADFEADVFSGEAPFAVQFTDLSDNTPNTWLWDFGDGKTSTEQNPLHIYTESGTYTVTLTASSPPGSDGETKVNYITVSDALDAGPVWGIDGDPLAELMNRGEGTKSLAAASYPGVLARNPISVKAPNGDILFFCHSASGFTNNGHGLTFAIRMKRSTDNGLTWSTPQDIYNYNSYNPNASWFELSGVVVDYIGVDSIYTNITLFGTKGDTTNQHHQTYIMTSDDNGNNWSAPTEITSQITNPSYTSVTVTANAGSDLLTTSASHSFVLGQALVFSSTGTLPAPLVAGRTYFARVAGFAANEFKVHPTATDANANTNTIDITDTGTGVHSVNRQWAWNRPGGVGIQLSDNTSNPGRLLMAGTHRAVGFNPNDSFVGSLTTHVMYSDDGGFTWGILGSLSLAGTGDGTLLETTAADRIMLNSTNHSSGARYQTFSTNGGVSWGATLPVATLPQSVAGAQLVRFNTNTIMLAAGDGEAGRAALYISSDEGSNWNFAKTLHWRLSQNSSIVAINDNHAVLCLENSDSPLSRALPASNFANKTYQSISVLRFNRVWVENTSAVNHVEWFFNEEASGVKANPYGSGLIDFGGTYKSKASAVSTTDIPLYTANGIEVTSANDDAIELVPAGSADFMVATSGSFTIEVEATIAAAAVGIVFSSYLGAGLAFEVTASGFLRVTISDGSNTTIITGTSVVNDDVRRCYAVVRDKAVTNKIYIYIDGNLESGSATDTTNSILANDGMYLGQNLIGGQYLEAVFHSCRITNTAVSDVNLKVAPRTKTTVHSFRNYTPPTPPAFVPTDLTNLETWLFATVDEGESAFADSQWSLSYKLPYYSGAKIQSYRDKSPNRYFFNVLEDGWIEYIADNTIGTHYRPYFHTTPVNSNLTIQGAALTAYDFIPGGTFAIGMAVKINSMVGGGDQLILDTQGASSSNAGFYVYVDSNRKPGMNVGGGAGAFSYTFTSASAMTVGNWYFLLFVGRGYGTGMDLYIGEYTNGAYDPDNPTVPTLTKYTSTNMTAPALTTNAYALTVGARASDGGTPSDIHLKNLIITSNASQFATGDTINQDKLCEFNVLA